MSRCGSPRSLRQLNATAQHVAAQLNLVVGEDVVVDQPGNAVIVFTGGRLAAADPRVAGLSGMPGVQTRSRPASPQYKAWTRSNAGPRRWWPGFAST